MATKETIPTSGLVKAVMDILSSDESPDSSIVRETVNSISSARDLWEIAKIAKDIKKGSLYTALLELGYYPKRLNENCFELNYKDFYAICAPLSSKDYSFSLWFPKIFKVSAEESDGIDSKINQANVVINGAKIIKVDDDICAICVQYVRQESELGFSLQKSLQELSNATILFHGMMQE